MSLKPRKRDDDFKTIIDWYTQCSPYQAVTGKIYRLKQHFLPPTTAFLPKLNNFFKKNMQVVIRSDPHNKMNEYMEKYNYQSTKRTAQR